MSGSEYVLALLYGSISAAEPVGRQVKCKLVLNNNTIFCMLSPVLLFADKYTLNCILNTCKHADKLKLIYFQHLFLLLFKPSI